jgi:Tol biopolymer transport system component
VTFPALLTAALLAAGPQPAPFDSSPKWAPDGSAVAFLRLRNVQRRDLTSEIYLVRRDGTRLHRITRGARDFFVSWSPDGRSLAFARARRVGRAVPQVYVVHANGKGLRRLVLHAAWSSVPAWSPDGRELAFAGMIPGLGEGIFVSDGDGRRLRQVFQVPPAVNSASVVALNDLTDLSWSPDGTRLLFELQDWLYVLRLDDVSATRLAARGYTAIWSPDSRSIAFVQLCRLAVIGDDGAGTPVDPFQCAQPASQMSPPSWSPDGARIATGDCRLGGCRILIAAAERGAVRTVSPIAYGFSPAWSPDGALIAFVRPTARSGSVVYAMRPDGTRKRALSAPR